MTKPVKITFITIGAVVFVALVGAIAWLFLRALVPVPSGAPVVEQSVDPQTTQAEQLRASANKKIQSGDIMNGIKDLKKAQLIYKNQHNDAKVAELDEQIRLASKLKVPDQPDGPYIDKRSLTKTNN